MADEQRTGSVELGARLKKVREAAGLSQHQLASRLGVVHTTIGRIEKGARSTTLQMVHRWHTACGYELDAVAVGSVEQAASLAVSVAAVPERELSDVLRVVESWPRLRERTKGRILGLVDGDLALDAPEP